MPPTLTENKLDQESVFLMNVLCILALIDVRQLICAITQCRRKAKLRFQWRNEEWSADEDIFSFFFFFFFLLLWSPKPIRSIQTDRQTSLCPRSRPHLSPVVKGKESITFVWLLCEKERDLRCTEKRTKEEEWEKGDYGVNRSEMYVWEVFNF